MPKGEIARFVQFLLLSLCFQKAVCCRGVRKLLGKGLMQTPAVSMGMTGNVKLLYMSETFYKKLTVFTLAFEVVNFL